MTVFGSLALIATVLTLFLPETKDREIPDNINDVQELHDLDDCLNDNTEQGETLENTANATNV